MFPQFPQNKEKYCSFCNPKNLQKCGNGLYATWEQQIDNLHLIFIFRHRVFRLTFHTMMSQPTIPQKWPGDSLAHEPITSAPIARHGCQFYVRENCFHEISKANAPGEECRFCSQDFRLQKTRVGSPPTGSFLSLGWKNSKQNSLKFDFLFSTQITTPWHLWQNEIVAKDVYLALLVICTSRKGLKAKKLATANYMRSSTSFQIAFAGRKYHKWNQITNTVACGIKTFQKKRSDGGCYTSNSFAVHWDDVAGNKRTRSPGEEQRIWKFYPIALRRECPFDQIAPRKTECWERKKKICIILFEFDDLALFSNGSKRTKNNTKRGYLLALREW